MKSDGHDTGHVADGQRTSLRRVVVRDLLTVTWRMLIPTMIGLFGGMYIDTLVGSSPVGFLVGASVGFVCGILLALRVLAAVKGATS
ncbi:MAG: AtpZ/AtpI family protein [Candidatus Saccharimonadales bacterium]